MTPEMVVWTFGFPADDKTKDKLFAHPGAAWRYNNILPYNYWVYFKNGRVSSWGADGQIP